MAGRLWVLAITWITIVSQVHAQIKTIGQLNFTCPQGWEFFGTSCYLPVSALMEWEDAENNCERYLSKLTIITDEEENGALSKMASTSNWDRFWSGEKVTDKCKGYWDDNQPPSTSSSEDCAAIQKNGRWKVVPCKSRLPSFCRKPACIQGTFDCGNGRCMNNKWLCDGINDCGNNLDEMNCNNNCTYRETGTIGNVNYQNYPNNAYCLWTIISPPGTQLAVTFTTFKSEETVDYLEVWVGGQTLTESHELEKVSGDNDNKVVYSTNNMMILRFISDSSVTGLGFQLTWTSSVPELSSSVSQMTAGGAWTPLSSPFYPQTPPSGFRREWLISSSDNTVVTLEVEKADLSPEWMLIIYNGEEYDDPIIMASKASDLASPAIYISSGTRLRVIMKSKDTSGGGEGIKMRFKNGCSVDIQAASGMIESPGYNTSRYPTSVTCSWILRAPTDASRNMMVKFLDLNVESDGNDLIQVYNGSDATAMALHTNNGYSGNMSGALPANRGGPTLFVQFISSVIQNNGRFRFEFSIDCPTIPDSPQMMKSGSNTSYESTVRTSCQTGYSFRQEEYYLNASVTFMCEKGGKWDKQRYPTCQVIYCGAPPAIEFGFLTNYSGSVTYGSKATYDCYNGFDLQGNTEVTCLDNGLWSTRPVCSSSECGTPPNVDNSQRKSLTTNVETTYGTVIEYTCNEGYEILITSRILCQKNTTWSQPTPVCTKKQCPLPVIANSHSLSVSTPVKYETEITLTCETGYVASTTNTSTAKLTCGSDSTFGNITCDDEDECIHQQLCINPTTVDCVNTIGSFNCVCKSGYRKGSTPVQCKDIDECAEQTSGCDQHCTNTNGSYQCSCNSGYKLFHNGTNGAFIVNGETGQLKGDVYHVNHSCVPNTCTRPDELGNGTIHSQRDTFHFEDEIMYSCKIGFILTGNSKRTCQANGNWSGSDPTCIAAICEAQVEMGSPEQIAQVKDIYPKRNLGFRERVIIECKKVDGSTFNKTRFCAYDRISQNYTLQGDAPECPVVDCGPVDSIAGLIRPTLNSTVYETSFNFQCETGASVSGVSTDGSTIVTCLQNGRWGYGNLTCSAASCPDPGTKGGTRQVKTSYEQGNKVTYECVRNGFTPTPSAVITCVYNNDTGKAEWDNEAPTCIDTTAPMFDDCGGGPVWIDAMAAPGFSVPTAQDNSGLVTVTLANSSAGFNSSDPVMRNTIVDYIATDGSGNTTQCRYFVNVTDYSPGNLTCPDRIQYNANATTKTYTITDKLTYTGGNLTSHPQVTVSLDKVGTVTDYRVTLKTDQETESTCAFQVEIVAEACTHKLTNNPQNGRLEPHTDGSIYSEVICNNGFAFADGSSRRNYTCSGQNEWTPSLPVEDCQRYSTSGYAFHVNLELQSRIPIQSFNTCYINFTNLFNTTVAPRLNRRCNIGGSLDTYYQFTITQVVFNSNNIFNHEANVTLRVENNDGSMTALNTCASNLNNVKIRLFELNTTECGITVKSNSIGVDTAQSGQSCDKGFNLRKIGADFKCLPCPKGMYYRMSSKSCEECPDGQYQDQAGEILCKPCGSGMASITPRTSANRCINKCVNGFTSETGNPPCVACPVDTYWNSSTQCLQCPNGGSTLNVEGSSNNTMCKGQCPVGQYSKTGYKPCTPCPLHFYQNETGQTMCKECAADQTTAETGSTSDSDCNSAGNSSICFKSCSTPGTAYCEYIYHRPVCSCKAGYEGSSCDIEINKCTSDPCQNGATCNHQINGYTCQCPSDTVCNMTKDSNRYKTIQNILLRQDKTEEQCKILCIESTACVAAAYWTNSNICELLDEQGDSEAKSSDIVTNGAPLYFNKKCFNEIFYNGTHCENDLRNDCENHPCSENSVCRDLIENYECVCPSDGQYSEPRCDRVTNLCNPQPCKNGGTCESWNDVRYQCSCPRGYSGDNCEIVTDECEANPSGCLYGGECVDGVDSYSCSCDTYFSGDHCEEDKNFCTAGACSNGLCVNNYDNLTANCICEHPYEKDSNGLCRRINFCASDPCINSTYTQQCESLLDGYRCVCQPGYEGSQCQHNVDNCVGDPCVHGTCVDGVEEYTCKCDSGWTGDTCNDDVVDCNGQCNSTLTKQCVDLNSDYKCECSPGYTGKNCTDEINECDSLPCQHGGTCVDRVNGYSCNCTQGWEGDDCESLTNMCSSVSCQNEGTCYNLYENYFCSCQLGTQGLLCEDSPEMCNLVQPCTDKGTCQQSGGSAFCNCTAGTEYGGKSCQLIADQCSMDVCQNGGTCSLTEPMGYTCVCPPGYSGRTCESPMDICQGKCQSGSTCVMNGQSAICVCPPNQTLTGSTCKDSSPDFDLFLDGSLEVTAVTSSTPFYLSDNITIMFWIGYFNTGRSVIISNTDGTEQYFELYEDHVRFSSDGQVKNVTLEENKNLETIKGQWDHVAVTWASNGDYSIYINGLMASEGNLGFSLSSPGMLKQVSFDAKFTGYISRLTVWKSILSVNDILLSIGNTSFIPAGQLALGWTSYTLTRGSRKYTPSQAGLEVKLCSHGRTKYETCDGLPVSDKTGPSLTPCLATDFIFQSSNRVVETGVTLESRVPSADGGENVMSTLTGDVITWGRYDIVYAAKDDEGNYGICRFKAYIQDDNPCDKRGFTSSPCGTSNAITDFCSSDQQPSVPTPNIIPCSKRGSYNFNSPLELFVPPVCGATSDQMFSLEVTLKYEIAPRCTDFAKLSVQLEIQTILNNTVSQKWSGLCQGACTNMHISSACDGNNAVAVIKFSSLPERLTKSGTISLKPDEVFLTTVKDTTDLDIQGSGTLLKNDIIVQLLPSCSGMVGEDKCVKCGPGSYHNSTLSTCVYCPIGTYTDSASQTSCTACSTNTITLRPGARSAAECVDNCAAGKYFTNGACRLCPRGFYQNREGQSFCYPCPPRQKTSEEGTDQANKCFDDCESGTELQDDGSCMDCPQGYYRTRSINDGCQLCPGGNTTVGTRTKSSSDCVLPNCLAGNYINQERVCLACPRGEFQPIKWQRSCIKCNESYTTVNGGSTNKTDCQYVCPKGQELSGSDTSRCTPCPVGKYRDDSLKLRFENCSDCPTNFTTSITGSSSESNCSIRICLAGSYRNKTDNKCYPCPTGEFQPENLMTECRKCPSSYTTKSTGSVNETQCQFFCQDGFQILSAENETCTICPRGTYRSNIGAQRFLNCQACPNDKTTNTSGSKLDTDCKLKICSAGQTLTSDLGGCSDCPVDTYQGDELPISTSRCIPCGDGRGTKQIKSTAQTDCLSFCEAGQQVGASGRCEECPQGTWNDGSTQMRFQPCKVCYNSNFTTPSAGATTSSNCTLRNCEAGYKIVSNNCEPCGFGKYQPQRAQTNCIDCGINLNTSTTTAVDEKECTVSCPPGEQGQNGSCVACPDDTYKDTSGYEICRNCPGSLTSSEDNRFNCSILYCDRGVGYIEANETCMDCEQGFYKASRGNSPCDSCPENFTTAGAKATGMKECNQLNCEPGFFAHNTDTCIPCPVGYYKSSVGTENCTKCPDDKTTQTQGATSAADCSLEVCPPGKYRSRSNTCVNCTIGQYQPNTGATGCMKCDDGYTTLAPGKANATDCLIVCPPGKYRSAQDTCSECDVGRYQPNNGTDTCISCTAGFTTHSRASISETDCYKLCPAGSFRPTDSRTDCNPCPFGQYQSSLGEMSCQSCNASYTTLQEGSNSTDQCMPQCGAGKYLNVTSRSCIDCPLGTYMSDGGTKQNCTNCPDGKTTANTGSTRRANCEIVDCSPGYFRKEGVACQPCGQGKYQSEKSQTSCISCPSGFTTRLGVTTAVSEKECRRDCQPNHEYNYFTDTCDTCPIGKIRNKTLSDYCTFCPPGQTTKREGAANCEDIETDPTITPFQETITLFIIFELQTSCQGLNVELLDQNIKSRIISLIKLQAAIYPGICDSSNCRNIIVHVSIPCGSSRVKRATGNAQNLTVEVTAPNVASQIPNVENTLWRSGESLLVETLGDDSIVNESSDLNGLVTYKKIANNITITTSCPSGSLQGSNNICSMCPLGTFHHLASTSCDPCSVGQYQDQMGQSQCKPCVGKLSTRTTRTNSSHLCLSLCHLDANYCQNQGTCRNISADEVECLCTEKYTGDTCGVRLAIESDLPVTIIGVCVGTFVVLLLILAIGWFFRRRRSRAGREYKDDKLSINIPPADYDMDNIDYMQPTLGTRASVQLSQGHVQYPNMAYNDVYDFYQTDEQYSDRYRD